MSLLGSEHRALSGLLPGWPPKDGEYLDCSEQRRVSVGELWSSGGSRRNRFSCGLTQRVGQMQRDDANGVAMGGLNPFRGVYGIGHSDLLLKSHARHYR
jgi:hypothetical protein